MINVRAESDYFSIPKDGEIIHVGCQEPEKVSFWTIVTLPNDLERRHFRIFGTGYSIPEGYEYIGTTLDDLFVWHLFEKVARELG